MYDIEIDNFYTVAPWESPFYKRAAELRKNLKSGYKNAVLFYEQADTSTFRYRVYNIARQLEQSGEWRAVWFFVGEKDLLLDFIADIDLFCMCRVRWSIPTADLTDRLRAAGIPILFDVDDMVTDLSLLPLIASTLNVDLQIKGNYNYWFTYISSLYLSAAAADGFITTNDFLAERLACQFKKPTAVIPNFLNSKQLDVSVKCRLQKQSGSYRQPYILGYFSGTPSHTNDFKIISESLLKLLTRFDDMKLRVVGYMEFPNEYKTLIEDGRVEFLPLTDFITLQKLIAEVDVNLAPLALNAFTNCKSELKFFEAAAVQTITVASPSYTMKRAIKDSVNGYLAHDAQWYDILRHIYYERDAQKEVAVRALNNALSNYSGDIITKTIEAAYNRFA